MARHRRPGSPSRPTRPGVHRRVARPAVTAAAVVAAGAVTVSTAFAVTGASGPVTVVPTPRLEVSTTMARTPGTVIPTPAEAAAIAAAVRESPLTSVVEPSGYQVSGAVLARSDESWAWVELVPVSADVDRAVGVLHRGDAGWELVQLGSYEVGCGIVSARVATDLGLECPSQTPAYSA